jgi:hypothetical protein
MKIAVMILVHKHSVQLNALLGKLGDAFNFYIHIDAKSALKPEDITTLPPQLIIKKYPIHWGGFNIVAATYELMKAAYTDGNDYCLLISGQDFPIKSNYYIHEFLYTNKKIDFIEYAKLPRKDWEDNGGLDRVLYFWENRDEKGLLSFMIRRIRKYQRHFAPLRRKLDFPFFGGSNWFNLSRSTLEIVIEHVENSDYLKRFKYTRIADELWLQTLLISKLQQTSLINDSLRYIDWHSGPEYPRTLRTADLEMIRNSSALFARKFDWDVDPGIINTLAADL